MQADRTDRFFPLCRRRDQGQPIRTPRDARGDSCPTPSENVSVIFVALRGNLPEYCEYMHMVGCVFRLTFCDSAVDAYI